MAKDSVQHERPEWLLTKDETIAALHLGRGYDDQIEPVLYDQARKIAKWLEFYGEEDQIGTGDTAYHFYVIQLPLHKWQQFKAAEGEK